MVVVTPPPLLLRRLPFASDDRRSFPASIFKTLQSEVRLEG